MNADRLALISALFSVIASGASAETATGRITFIASDRQQLMLDSKYVYAVRTRVDLSSIGVANRVKMNWDKRNGKNVITTIAMAPLTIASYG